MRVADDPGDPRARPEQHGQQDDDHQVVDERDRDEDQPGHDDRQPEQPPPRQLLQQLDPEEHAGRHADEDRAEDHAVGRVTAAQRVHVDLGHPDHRAAGGEGAEHADDQTSDQPVASDEPPALDDLPQHRRGGDRGVPWFFGMSLSEKMMTAETRYANALMNRAR